MSAMAIFQQLSSETSPSSAFIDLPLSLVLRFQHKDRPDISHYRPVEKLGGGGKSQFGGKP
jgi:hypothetical protein